LDALVSRSDNAKADMPRIHGENENMIWDVKYHETVTGTEDGSRGKIEAPWVRTSEEINACLKSQKS
jgi:hypothetical protein